MFQQQGDVLIKQPGERRHAGDAFTGIPPEAARKSSNVLAEGEATGHAHRVVPVDEGAEAHLLELGERLFLRVLGGNVKVIHEEHHEQTIAPGEYEIERVMEYDPFAQAARAVAD